MLIIYDSKFMPSELLVIFKKRNFRYLKIWSVMAGHGRRFLNINMADMAMVVNMVGHGRPWPAKFRPSHMSAAGYRRLFQSVQR